MSSLKVRWLMSMAPLLALGLGGSGGLGSDPVDFFLDRYEPPPRLPLPTDRVPPSPEVKGRSKGTRRQRKAARRRS